MQVLRAARVPGGACVGRGGAAGGGTTCRGLPRVCRASTTDGFEGGRVARPAGMSRVSWASVM
jgi:hypothetical protein